MVVPSLGELGIVISTASGAVRDGGASPSFIVNCTWWRHQMETFSASLVLCAGNSPVTCEFPSQRPLTQSFDVFFDLRLNKQLSKQSRRRWFEMPSRSLWRHCNGLASVWTVWNVIYLHNTCAPCRILAYWLLFFVLHTTLNKIYLILEIWYRAGLGQYVVLEFQVSMMNGSLKIGSWTEHDKGRRLCHKQLSRAGTSNYMHSICGM